MCFMEKQFEIKVVSFIEIFMISNTHPKWVIKLFYHKFNDVLCRYFTIFIQKTTVNITYMRLLSPGEFCRTLFSGLIEP